MARQSDDYFLDKKDMKYPKGFKTKALSLSLHYMFIIHISDKGVEQLYCIEHFSAETNKHHTHT